MTRLLALVVLLALAASPSRAQGGLAATVDSLMTAYGGDGPGGVVAVTRGGEIVFAKGYGLADMEHGAPNTPTTPFHTASVSKQFTTFAIAMLAEQGLLSFDDDVRTHIPELPEYGSTITLRHLATHTSGLRDHWTLWAMSGGHMDDVFRRDDLLRLVMQQQALNFEPGAEHLYSNSGYLLLSEVVERVTGQTFGAWMDQHVFAPLGMSATTVHEDLGQIVPGRAVSYHEDEGDLERYVFNSEVMNLFSSAEDLARWLRNFHTAEIGGTAVAQLTRERGVLALGDTLDYGLGLYLDRHRGLRRIQHGGVAAGYRVFMAYYPDLDAGIVTLGNVASLDSEGIAEQVAEVVLAAHMTEPDSSGDDTDDGLASIPTERLDAYTGRYQIMQGPPFSVARGGSGLTIQLPGSPPDPLTALSETLFRIEDPGANVRLRFRIDAEGAINGGALLEGREVPFRRVRWSPDAAALAEFAGRYTSPELETSYDAHVEDGRLVLRHLRHGTIALTPTEEDAFGGTEWFLSSVVFDRGEDGDVSGLRMSNQRVRDLRFEKQE